jgi:hypothetical protein
LPFRRVENPVFGSHSAAKVNSEPGVKGPALRPAKLVGAVWCRMLSESLLSVKIVSLVDMID